MKPPCLIRVNLHDRHFKPAIFQGRNSETIGWLPLYLDFHKLAPDSIRPNHELDSNKRGEQMQINPPTKVVYWISAIVAIVGLVFNFLGGDILPSIAIYIVFAGYVLLFLGNTLKGF
jgi:hypothetical protein